jgi:hypothetical protein
MDFPLTPFPEWSLDEAAAQIAALPGMPTPELKDLVESLSEGWQDTPEHMREHYHAARAELETR